MPSPVDPAKRSAIVDAIRAGHGERSRGDIAREFGVAGSTVARIAAQEGIVGAFARARTKEATASRQADMAERRALLAERLLSKADELLDQMDNPHLVFAFGGKDNGYNEHLLQVIRFRRSPVGAWGSTPCRQPFAAA